MPGYACVGGRNALNCSVTSFPINYLGLPLSTRKVHSSAFLPLVDKIAKKLPTWRAALLSRGERLALVPHVLCAMPVHLLLAMALNKTIHKLVTRVIRDFLWHGRKEARHGNCPVSWPRACRPIEMGGLGVRDLQRTGIALRLRWLWLQAIDPTHPWRHLPPPCEPEVRQIFRASTTWTLGDGHTCKFWTDHWLDGASIAELAPVLASLVPRRRQRRRPGLTKLDPGYWWQLGARGHGSIRRHMAPAARHHPPPHPRHVTMAIDGKWQLHGAILLPRPISRLYLRARMAACLETMSAAHGQDLPLARGS